MRVEGAEGPGVLVDGVEVCVVFLEDDFAEGFFLGCARMVLVGFFFWFEGGGEGSRMMGQGKAMGDLLNV